MSAVTQDQPEKPEKTSQGSEVNKREPVQSKDFYDDAGDQEILSSNNVLFKVHKWQIMASPVFRAMIAGASESRLELSDRYIENDLTLKGLFEVVISGRVTCEPITRLIDVVWLAQKYEFDLALSRIALRIECDCRASRLNNDEVIVMGAALRSTKLCLLALTTRARVTDPGLSYRLSADFGKALPGGSSIDPASLSYSLFRTIDYAVLWTWLRAFRIGTASSLRLDESSQRAIAAEYERLTSLHEQRTESRPGAKKELGDWSYS